MIEGLTWRSVKHREKDSVEGASNAFIVSRCTSWSENIH